MELLEIKVDIQIQKPAEEVFEAVADPEKMKNYFISEGTGRLESGQTVIWKFPEFDLSFPVKVGKVEKGKYISFYWEVGTREVLAELLFEPVSGNSTIVTILEKGMENNQEGLNWLKGNTEGWANFAACLKAWLEYGINLRKGAFGHRKFT